MEKIGHDLRFATRMLRNKPIFTSVTVVTLALGIGANTAIFTLVNAVLLKPLPVDKPEELVFFNDSASEGTSAGDPPTGEWRLFSYSAYRYFREHNQSFKELSAFRSGEDRVSVRRTGTAAGEPAHRASAHLVSGSYFAVLGVNAARGRVFNGADDSPAAQPAAVISNGYWKQQYGSDPAVLNSQVMLNGTAFTIVGIMPPEFFGERVRRPADFWLPLAFQPQIQLRDSYLKSENVYWLNLIGRLNPGTQLQETQTHVNVQLQQFLADQAGAKLSDERRQGIANSYIRLAPGGRGLSGLRTFYASGLKTLMVVVVVVLLIACANIGNLLLSRGAARQSEIALRQALGASRSRLIRQLVTESLLLAVIGGTCGILLSQWGVSILVTLVARTSPLNVAPDLSVLSFTAAISLLSGIVFGIVPAFRATKVQLITALKQKTSQRRGRLRINLGSGLVIAQVALSLVLLVGAGLFGRSLLKLQNADLGFDRDNVLLVNVDTRLAGYKATGLSDLYRRLYERLSSLPNVRAVTLASYSPMSGTQTISTVTVRGYTPQPGEDVRVSDILIGPRYAEVLGLPLLVGREVGLQDSPSSTKVAVVNQAFARYFYHDENPIGRRITFDEDSDENDVEIVGVVGDAKYHDAKESAARTVYRPIMQVQDQLAFANVIQLRTAGDPMGLGGAVRAAIAEVDDKLPVGSFTSLRVQTEEALRQEKLMARLVTFFGLLALVLACVGLYGIMAHDVARRTNEIGIRMALGAERRNIIWMVLRESFSLVILGITIGVPAALLSAKLVSSQLFGLTPNDPLTLVSSTIVLASVAALAAYLPARKASRVDPLSALRYE